LSTVLRPLLSPSLQSMTCRHARRPALVSSNAFLAGSVSLRRQRRHLLLWPKPQRLSHDAAASPRAKARRVVNAVAAIAASVRAVTGQRRLVLKVSAQRANAPVNAQESATTPIGQNAANVHHANQATCAASRAAAAMKRSRPVLLLPSTARSAVSGDQDANAVSHVIANHVTASHAMVKGVIAKHVMLADRVKIDKTVTTRSQRE
jgi:hypothetical protein